MLSINFYPAFSPTLSGGEQRYLHLYSALSEYYDIDLVTSGGSAGRYEEIWHTPTLRELRFPKDEHWDRAFNTLENSGVTGDLWGLAFALAVSEPRCPLRQAALRLADSAAVVIHEFPYSEPIFWDSGHPFEVYNSHNFELHLLSSTIEGDGVGRCFQKLLQLERNLARRARFVFATSDDDGEKFRLLYGVPSDRLRYCPNGYSEAELAPIERARRRSTATAKERPELLFIGSQHGPNIDAVAFILDLAADLRDCDFTIAGGVCHHFTGCAAPENVRFFGEIDSSGKQRLFASADLFVNPVVRGSGTSLKSIEALAGFLPMVATPEAVRGLDLEAGTHAAVCERRGFACTIRSLLAAPERRDRIAEEGLAVARRKFTWPKIARRLAGDLQTTDTAPRRAKRQEAPSRPLLVALNDGPIDAAASGGGVRTRRVFGALAADVILLTFGGSYEATLLAPGLLQVTLAKSAYHRAFEQQMSIGQDVALDDIAASLFLGCDHVFADLLAQLAERCAAVIFEHCYMAAALDWLCKAMPDLPVVYAAHNVEAKIKDELLCGHPLRAPLVRFVAEIEQRLTRAADLVVTGTESDADHFRAAGARTVIVGNGSAVPSSWPPGNAREARMVPRVGFLGSSHPSDADAARYIVESLAPLFADTVFELAGEVCSTVPGPLPPNLTLRSHIDDAHKAEIFAGWRVALNPVQAGAGAGVRLAEYVAHGLPTITTPRGAGGFPIAEAGIGKVVERAGFPPALRELLGSAELRSEYGRIAREYAKEHLAWERQVAPLRDWLARCAEPSGTGRRERPRSLLVVTYRYTEPPLGGAEEYLIEVLRWLRPRFRTIELAAVDVVGPLPNRHYFHCGFTPGAGTPRILGELFDRARLFAPDAIPDEAVLSTCRQLERSRMRADLDLYGGFAGTLHRADAVLLLGGFYWPESDRHGSTRWSAPEFAFLIPGGTRVFGLAGWTRNRKQLVLSAIAADDVKRSAAVELHRQYIDASFTCTVALEESAAPSVILCTVDENDEPCDHRPFGILLRRAWAMVPSAGAPLEPGALTEIAADLGMEVESRLWTEHFEAWIDRLCRFAQNRSEEDEMAFAAVRGPHSRALQAWLAEHGARYDVALVQGIPFDTVPSTIATLGRLERPPRTVVLPHFHGEDRFYYWRRYLESCAAADKALFFSGSLAERIGDPEKNAVVPGGGVRIEEEASARFVSRFHELHPSRTPFFLVLGRKTSSKGYNRVIHAIGTLRATDRAVDLVMIGPDEDGLPIGETGVHYLGFQPRPIVLGALSACIGLVTMSSSESFGIVVCEAWRFRKPVIANRACGPLRDLIDDRTTGLLVDSDAELVAAMARIASDAALRARLGEAGFERAVSRFSWQSVADRIGDVLTDGL